MKAKILVILTLVVILSSSCSREVGCYDLTEAQLQIIPYEMGQVISFINSKNLTVNFTVTESNLEWYYPREENERDYVKCRFKSVTLESEQTDFKLSLVLSAGNYWNGHDKGTLEIFVGDNIGLFEFRCDMEGNFLPYNYSSFYDSLEINKKVCYNVVETKSMYASDKSVQLFYNKDYGILQINKNGKNFLTLKN